MSRDIPIIFSGPMVRALLDGRKTMTRRIFKLPTKTSDGLPIYERPDMGGWEPTTVGGGSSFTIGKGGEKIPAPEKVAIWHRTCGTCIVARYQTGDRLWVRENFAHVGTTDPGFLTYAATYPKDLPPGMENVPADIHDAGYKWTPCIHMPRNLSRLTLEVTAVKVERLQEISEADALAEGIYPFTSGADQMFGTRVEGGYAHAGLTARETFTSLWCDLHGPNSWNENPEVVALTFKVIKQNIDSLPKPAPTSEGRAEEAA